MKTKILIKAPRLIGRLLMLAAVPGLAFLPLAIPAAETYSLPSSYDFTTIVLKAPQDSVGGFKNGFLHPKSLIVDAAGNIYFPDMRRQVICKVTTDGTVTILAGCLDCIGSADGKGNEARFHYPRGIAKDADGFIFVADSGNNTIRRIAPGGVVSTVAGVAGTAGSADGFCGAARFNYPSSLAVDHSGTIYVADLLNYSIREITPSGMVTTLAGQAGLFGTADGQGREARFDAPVSIALDTSDNVYVADMFNNTIRKVTPAGKVTTMAGCASVAIGHADGTGAAARFSRPCGLAVDGGGNIYVADSGNCMVRRVSPAGQVVSVAGSGWHFGDVSSAGSIVTSFYPVSVAVDFAGNFYVSDPYVAVIRKGCPALIRELVQNR